MNKNAKIATLILRAQCASDGGKHNPELVSSRRSYRDNCAGYGNKDKCIYSALNLIVQGGTSFKFSVKRDGELALYLVYFEARVNGEKLQVSFHSYDSRLSNFSKTSFRIKWDRGSSRMSAIRIYSHFVKNGEYVDIGEWE